MGFSIVHTTTNLICDKFATHSTRPAVNSLLFSVDQMSLFLAGIVFGKMLEVAKDSDNGYLYWLVSSGFAIALSFGFAVIWRCVLTPAQRKKNCDEEKMHLATALHKMEYLPEPRPTES